LKDQTMRTSPTLPSTPTVKNGYPTSDGRPMAETDFHRILMNNLIETLQRWYADKPNVYVSGNLLLFYEEGNKRRHVSPDVFVAFGVPNQLRPNYLLWEEAAGPGIVIELTSSSTRREDTRTKFELYRDTLHVSEYFLFDPKEDYLEPSMQGYRLTNGEYRPIRMTEGRLRSRKLGLLLERDGTDLRLVNPDTGERLPTKTEALTTAEEARLNTEAENERLKREIEELRRRLGQ
jgi:Uma2 family endonuclease